MSSSSGTPIVGVAVACALTSVAVGVGVCVGAGTGVLEAMAATVCVAVAVLVAASAVFVAAAVFVALGSAVLVAGALVSVASGTAVFVAGIEVFVDEGSCVGLDAAVADASGSTVAVFVGSSGVNVALAVLVAEATKATTLVGEDTLAFAGSGSALPPLVRRLRFRRHSSNHAMTRSSIRVRAVIASSGSPAGPGTYACGCVITIPSSPG
jgi:hypothetical protein